MVVPDSRVVVVGGGGGALVTCNTINVVVVRIERPRNCTVGCSQPFVMSLTIPSPVIGFVPTVR